MVLNPIDLATIEAGFTVREFFVEYLPTIRLEDGCCVGGEALSRWRHGGVVIPPAEFIPKIERTPMAGRLTYWVMDMVAYQLGGWLVEHPDAHLGINVPPEILGRGGLAYVAEKSGLSALRRQLVLEVTERGVPDELGMMALKGANAAGVRIALDDVELSGSNLALLTRCPFDFVKLDRSLVAQISPEAPLPQWLEAIDAISRVSSVEIIAEGIEDAFQARILRESGVRFGQGFFYSRPISRAAFVAFHATNLPSRR